MTAELPPPGQRLRHDVLDPLKRLFVGKDEIVDVMGVCLVAGENLFLLGPPGTAKTALVHALGDRLDHQVHVAQARLLEAAHDELAEVRGRGVRIEQRNARLVGPCKAARSSIGLVVEFADRLEHCLPGLLAHTAFAVDDAADSHRRAAGEASDVGDRRRALVAVGPAGGAFGSRGAHREVGNALAARYGSAIVSHAIESTSSFASSCGAWS